MPFDYGSTNISRRLRQNETPEVIDLRKQQSEAAYEQASGGNQKQALKNLQTNQISQAQAFRERLPALQDQNAGMLRRSASQGLQQNLDVSKQKAASRGLLYGGMQQGKEAGLRQQSGTALSGAIAKSNAGLLDSANMMDQQAIGTATGEQQSQQAIQSMAYSQAQAQLNSQNSMMSGLMQTGLLYALMA